MAEMDIVQTKTYAAEYMVRQLASGKDFRGLGPEAEYLIRATAYGAEHNAKFISEKTSRTVESFTEMHDRVRDQFVQDVLGFSTEKRSLVEATSALVESVWQAYIDWAEEGKKAA